MKILISEKIIKEIFLNQINTNMFEIQTGYISFEAKTIIVTKIFLYFFVILFYLNFR
jgi:hypothetical protein